MNGTNARAKNAPSDIRKRSFAIAYVLLLLLSPLLSVNFTFAAYTITIGTSYDGVPNGISVPIMMDGAATGFNTPHTFSGLEGPHDFTVPYEDVNAHPFRRWDNAVPSDDALTTISVSSSGTYWAFYDTHVPRNNGGIVDAVSPAQQRYYITPSDPAVIASASSKSWSDILNWIASHITYNQTLKVWQFPNETLALGSGQCREFSTLAVSMLIARGYVAYIVSGQVMPLSGIETIEGEGHVWIAIKINGALYHFEPQRTWANQPSPYNFTGYHPEHFNDHIGLYPTMVSLDPPPAETYDVTINTNYNGEFNTINVPITLNGLASGFSTPHTFAGLTGAHNFSVPYTDSAAHPFMCWGTNYPGNKNLPAILVTAGGSFSAFYDTGVVLSNLYPAEYMYLVTPSDPAVVAAAGTKTVSAIVDFVSNVTFAYNTAPQYPNQTLAMGTRYFLDYASLCTSMLRTRGYTAYIVGGNASGSSGGRWVVFNFNGIFYHVDPAYSWTEQQTLNFGTYEPAYYVDERGIYLPGASQNPPAVLPGQSPTPSPTATPTASPNPTPSFSNPPATTPPPTQTPTAKPTMTPTPSTVPTSSPTPTQQASPSASATATPTSSPTHSNTLPPSPSPSLPEFPALFAAAFIVVASLLLVALVKKRGC